MTDSPTGGGMPASGDHLTCGRSIDELLEQVADGRAGDRDLHQSSCPHCQAALGEYDRIWSPLRELAAEKVTAPDGFIDGTLARIRGAIENPDYGVIDSHTDAGPGVTRVAARVVVVAARLSAQRVPGVRVALGRRLDPTAAYDPAGAAVTAGVAGASTAIEITLAADYGTDLRALGDEVRRSVSTRVRELTDLEPVEITVVIDDVFT